MKTLNLFGIVYPASDCINAKSVTDFLSDVNPDEEFMVYLNSCGGNVFEGLAIYNLLSEHQNNMTIKVIGEASSIASVIACAGGKDKVLVAETALMLVHKPWTFAMVDEDELKKVSKSLNTIKNSIITAYERKTGLDNIVLDALMTEADYRNAEDCVKLGFADAVYVPSDLEATAIVDSNNFKNEMLKKYMIMNLNIENNFSSSTMEKDNFMTFKNLDEAVVEIGRLNERLKTFDENSSTIINQQVELKIANDYIVELNNMVKDSELEKASLQEQVFHNEAVLFCEKQFLAGKLSRAEINGQADLEKNETPAKVVKLVALRKLSQELYDLEIAEISARSADNHSYLSEDISKEITAPVSDSDYLAKHIEEKFNKRK